MPEVQNSKDRLKEITASIESGIKDLFQSEKYQQYLRTMSRFHRYSVNNTMLIYMQKPDATLVAGFNKWKDQFERNVIKGERGIKIIAPTPFKKKIEQEKLDPDTRLPMLDADGKIIIEEKTVQIPMYKVVSVFDVSQTDGKPLPTIATDLAGNVQNYDVFMEALKRSAPVPIAFEAMQHDMDGYFSDDEQRIAVREGMSEVQTVSATVHEIAHSKLHNKGLPEIEGEAPASEIVKKSRNTEEVEAESVSFAVCAYYGIPTGENSFGYIASWSQGKELPELRSSLETINKTASGLISDIDRNYAVIMKERGLDKAEHETVPANDTPDAPIDDEAPLGDGRILDMKVEANDHNTTPDYPANAIMPDPTVSIESMNAYGYTDGDMLPLSKERAMELFERDITVYMLYDGNGSGMAFEAEDIALHTGIFGVTREEWEEVKESVPAMKIDTDARQKQLEQDFLDSKGDSFAIYQLDRDNAQTVQKSFMGMEYLEMKGLTVERSEYIPVYTGELLYPGDTYEKLDGIYTRFNIDHPLGFQGHSLSVSDIVALKQDGVVSCHYVDSIGFKELPAFLQPENYLKNAEMAMEDDYGMIDGVINNGVKQPTVAELEQQAKSGQPISLMDLMEAGRRECQQEGQTKPKPRQEKRPSVLAQLRAPLDPTKNKKAPINEQSIPRNTEREM